MKQNPAYMPGRTDTKIPAKECRDFLILPFSDGAEQSKSEAFRPALRTAPQKWECQQKAYAVVRHMLFAYATLCLFILRCLFPFYFHKNFNSHKEQTPGAPNRTAESTDARFRDRATPVNPESRFKIQKLSPPPMVLVRRQRTGLPVFTNKIHIKIPRQHATHVSIFHHSVIPTGNSWFPKRDFCSFASRSKKRYRAASALDS